MRSDNGIIIPAQPFIERARKAYLDNDPQIQKLIKAVVRSKDQQLAIYAADYLEWKMTKAQLERYPFTTPTEADLSGWLGQGTPLPFGFVHKTDMPFVYTLNWLMQHIFGGGASGTGKTNFLSMIALEAMKFLRVWVVDKEKQDYRHCTRLDPNLRVFDAQENFIRNPMQVPPRVKPEHHLTSFSGTFCKTQNLLDGSYNLMTKAAYSLYERMGIFRGSDSFPILADLRDKIRSYNLRGNYRALGFQNSLLNRLDAFLMECPNTYSYPKGYPIEELSMMSFVLQVKGLGERHGRFFVDSLVTDLFNFYIANNMRSAYPRNLILIDEAKWMIPPGFNENLGFSPFAGLLAQCREVGIGFVLADQTLDLEPSIFVQSRAKFIFRLGSGQDIERARKTLALTKEQADFIHKLDTGQCIVRIPKVDPFVIQVPKIRLE